MSFNCFSPVRFYFTPDDGVSANGAPATNTSTPADTSANDGKNTGTETEGAGTAPDTVKTETDAPPQGDAANAETPDSTKESFKAIASQDELDRILKERLERQKASLKAAWETEQKKAELEASGKWEELYKESQKASEARQDEIDKELAEVKAQLDKREQDAIIERAINAHKLDKDAAELFRDAVEGKSLDAKAMEDKAKKYAKAMAAPVAPATEGGQQTKAADAALVKTDHYSFNPQGGVKW